MSRPGVPDFMRPGNRLPVLFVVGILLPGIVLVVFSARAFLQEARITEQQERDRREAVASNAIATLDAELGLWQAAVDVLAATGELAADLRAASPATAGSGRADWPAEVREVLAAPEGAILVSRSGDAIATWPAVRLPYAPGGARPSVPGSARRSAGLAAAERAENGRDYPRAIALYESLLARARSKDRALLLHRLARTLQKAGETGGALRTYRELQSLGTEPVGALPAEFLAGYGICSLWEELGVADELVPSARELYAGLVAGRWQIERARYLFYSEQARRWLGLDEAGSATDLEALRATEIRKLAFAATVEEFLEEPRGVVGSGDGLVFAFWSAEPFVALVMPADIVRKRIWEPVVSAFGDPRISLELLHEDENVVFGAGRDVATVAGSGVPSEATPPPTTAAAVIRRLNGRRYPLAVQASPSRTSTMQADLVTRQLVYVGMLGLAVVLLAFGSYMTARNVRREVEVARLKSRFVSTVSHEFRSPLTGIRQIAEMLMRDRVPSEERKQSYYRMIARESSRLTRLVENVLDFSRIEEDRREYTMEPLDTAAWLARVAKEFRQELHGQSVTIEAEIPSDLPHLRGDREALTCAVHNLLDNAVKYSPGVDTVWLEAEASNGTLAVRVRDRGIGISRQDRRRVFEKFFRGGGEATEDVKGVGLGLSLVQHIVAAHGGSIALDSEPGIGSTFTIELPAEPSETER